MIDLINKGLPGTVLLGGEPFAINTDFRVWMRFCNDFETWDRHGDMDIMYIFADRVPLLETEEDMVAILDFAYPPTVVPRSHGGDADRILDYKTDADYIYSAFLGQYGIDLTETDMHWHKFKALLNGLNSSTKLHDIMGYRCYEGSDKEYTKLRHIWELSMELSENDKQTKERFDSYFD